jgi:hypothetical protein
VSAKPARSFLQFPTPAPACHCDVEGNFDGPGFVTHNRSLLFGCTLVLAGCVNQIPPANPPSPQTGSASDIDRVWFTGSSNIRRFTCHAGQVYVTAEAAPEEFQRTKEDGLSAVRSAALQVPVQSLDCGIGMQNRHLFETLGATANPAILFVLGSYSVEQSGTNPRVRILGTLRIAGVERNVVLYGTVFRDGVGAWMLRGERPINVRDFGVTPPRRFLGLLRVRDEITVHFEIAVRPLIDPLGVLVGLLQ